MTAEVEDLEQLIEIPEETGYWFVRTDYGENFETYYQNDFIAIGWNYITLDDIYRAEKNPAALYEKIIKKEGFDPHHKQTKGKVTRIINKIIAFKNLKEGDVIIIPSRNSSRYAFGRIADEMIYTDPDQSFECNYYKRRKVDWYVQKSLRELDPNFFRMRFTQHTISSVYEYSKFIDNVMNALYKKNDYAYFSFDIKTQNDINADELLRLMTLIKKLIHEANEAFSYHEDIESLSIRINLQSPGSLTFKQYLGKSLLAVGTILIMAGCNPNSESSTENLPKEKRIFVDNNKDTLDEVKIIMDSVNGDFRKTRRNYGH